MNRMIREALMLTVASVICAVLAAFVNPKTPTLKQPGVISLEAVDTEAKVLWVDARSREDFEAGHVPGARMLNEDAWDELLPGVLNAWEEGMLVVVYCGSSGCQTSRQIVQRLREEVGLEDVVALKGGWEGWIAAGRLQEKGAARE
jgi:3-mercaptopyruvate sulfurtransferase SseA